MQRNITPIDELPDLEDLERNAMSEENRNEGPNMRDQLQKYIRGSYCMNKGAGMQNYEEHFEENPQQAYQRQAYQQQTYQRPRQQIFQQQPYQEESHRLNSQQISDQPPVHLSYNCVDIAKHISECPICSKFYNNDKTIYIIVIIILSIVCILLLKRVLNL